MSSIRILYSITAALALSAAPALAESALAENVTMAPGAGSPSMALGFGDAHEGNLTLVLNRFGMTDEAPQAARDAIGPDSGLPAPVMQSRPRIMEFGAVTETGPIASRQRLQMGNYWSIGAFR
jgi:hypothetical protein